MYLPVKRKTNVHLRKIYIASKYKGLNICKQHSGARTELKQGFDGRFFLYILFGIREFWGLGGGDSLLIIGGQKHHYLKSFFCFASLLL